MNDLTAMEARVLGSLIEKELATPEYYPLSLNALVNACNQKSNREPVVSYDEQTVGDVVDGLVQKELVFKSGVGRVPKYEELFTRKHNFVTRESAVLCILLLRGPQTIGEIRGRTARLCTFESLEEVQETLNRLAEWQMVRQLARQPGQKESRFVHLLSAQPEAEKDEPGSSGGKVPNPETGRDRKIEQEIEALRDELENLKREFREFKGRFD
ncbi:MAG: YceH family protein [Desulfobacterales bacterium]